MDQQPEGSSLPSTTTLEKAAEQARALAKEQVAAAWQLYVDRVKEQLDSGWESTLDGIFRERFTEIVTGLRQNIDQQIESSAGRRAEELARDARQQARREVGSVLNNAARRLRAADSAEEWTRAFTEAASAFSKSPAVLIVSSEGVQIAAWANGRTREETTSLADAPALRSVVESRDTVICSNMATELSQPMHLALNEAVEQPGTRVYLLPVTVRQSVVAILAAFADSDAEGLDTNPLEALSALAALPLESADLMAAPKKRPSAGDGLVQLAANAPARTAPRPAWSELSRSEQEVHLRAQRFARTSVADLVLHQMERVRVGRETRDLYGTFKGEIDAHREAFRNQFAEGCPSMVDYYHLELLRTLAKDDPDALGPEYPGPLLV